MVPACRKMYHELLLTGYSSTALGGVGLNDIETDKAVYPRRLHRYP